MRVAAGPVPVLVAPGSLVIPRYLLRGRTRSAATFCFCTWEREELLRGGEKCRGENGAARLHAVPDCWSHSNTTGTLGPTWFITA